MSGVRCAFVSHTTVSIRMISGIPMPERTDMNLQSDPMSRVPRIHLASLGCAKNLVDSERLLARLATAGGLVGAPAEDADVIIVNTCGFIGPATAESLTTIRDCATHKRGGSCARLLVMGCLVERDIDELRAKLPDVDGFFGLDQHGAIVAACGLEAEPEDGARLLLTPSHTAYLRISDGCDNRCAYCTIPAIRGPFRSRPPGEILDEARQLVELGVRELNVIGQDTTSYGKDLTDPVAIDALLRRLAGIPDLRWIRLLYTHPAHFSDELIEAYASIDALCPYVDVPLQHLSDEILRRMGRRTTQADCLALVDRLRRRVPGVAIRTTFIVGFPGEARAQFAELLNLVRRIQFDHVGVFRYSNERGTPAAGMPEQVSERTKAERQEALMLAQQEIAFAKNGSMIGKVVQVLIDRPSDEAGLWIGRTRAQAPDVDSETIVLGNEIAAGDFVEAQVIDVAGYDLIAQA
jgi:ribosomal protein S12 methylthiotransferase